MFAFLLIKIVRNPISTPIIIKTREQFINYSSIPRIHENQIVEVSSSAIENHGTTSLAKLLRSYDFTDPQIAKIFTKLPIINSSHNTADVIKPKLDFFLDVGFSNIQLAKFISSNSCLLETSLETRIKPNTLLLKSFYETDEQFVRALFYTYKLLQSKLETNFFPNVRTLTNHGVPRGNIIKLASQRPRTLLEPAKKFEKMVQLVASMGFNPCSTLFCTGLHVISGINPLKWKAKVLFYKSLGWSEENVVFAFTRHPWCMLQSEKKIEQIMKFFVDERHCEPSYLAKNPVLIGLSLENRIMPRCLVIDILVKKQLVKKSNVKQFLISNKDFLEKYVMCYQDQAPEVLHAYFSSDALSQIL